VTTQANPRYELVFEGQLSGRRRGANVIRELRTLGQRSRSTIGDVYAAAARVVLNGIERLEDLNAERRFKRRANAPAAPSRAPRPKKPLPRK
jgi:hypothetical protein